MEMSFKSLPLGVLPKRGVQADRVMREHHPKPEALTASLGYHLQNLSSPQGAPFIFLLFYPSKNQPEKRIDTAWFDLQGQGFFDIINMKDRRLSGLTTGSETLHPQGAYKPPKVALGQAQKADGLEKSSPPSACFFMLTTNFKRE